MTNLLSSFTERLSIFGSKKSKLKTLLSSPRRRLDQEELVDSLRVVRRAIARLLAGPFGLDPLGRSLSLGFYFVHSRHEQDFCEREAINRLLRDLKHKRPHANGRQGSCR